MPVRSKRFRSVLFQSAFPRVPFFSGCAAIVLVMFSYGVMPASGQSNNAANGKPPSSTPREKAGSAPDVARGKYLVEGVAVCGQCHTPTDGSGNPDRSRWLQGGSVPYMPAKADSDWPISAPRIGGTPPASDADMVKLLTTGIWTNGNRLRLPMPQFRMDRSDAEAVVAYLKTVKAQQ
jgi:mono/diheme cytochrome c family protein